MIDTFWNVILFTTRFATLIMTAILGFNLIIEASAMTKAERVNGLWETRKAIIAIIIALFLESLIYGVGYIHSSFNTAELNRWLFSARPFLIVARLGMFYGVILLFRLFVNTKHK